MNEETPTTKLPGKLKSGLTIVRGRSARILSAGYRWLPQIAQLEAGYQTQDEPSLLKESLSLRYRAKSGEPLTRLLPQVFALVREAARRTIGLRHFDVQILGGVALANGAIAEMETGEGKTLTATLPLTLYALSGKGAHLATVNDYLAQRDAEWMTQIYQLLGFSVGVIQSNSTPEQRRQAYACDVVYGTAKEFGFDFLRDRLLLRHEKELGSGFFAESNGNSGSRPVGREAHFALVDEADSVLIDEARTPLIIGALDEKTKERIAASYRWAASAVDEFDEDRDYDYDHRKKTVELTAAGRQRVRGISHPPIMQSMGLIDLYEHVERAIQVQRDYHLDRQYVVRDGEIVIVDEFTGRLAEGRKWRDGIHQAVEAKEQLEVTVPTGQAARITVQDLFRQYRHLAGMTGTAASSAREFRKVYRLAVAAIPTNRPVQRQRMPDRVFADGQAKWKAIVQDVIDLHQQGRPVLIGTRSIDKSQQLSLLLDAAGIEHQVLNAHHVAAEAEIVAQAGKKGKVTVATNMAGRGTDIQLDPESAELGGLHVICSELHDSARIDRQLAGRCGRQGDPGSVQQFLAWDDDILASGLGPKQAERLKSQGDSTRNATLFYRAQRRVQRTHLRQRVVLLHAEKDRNKMQREIGQDPYLDTPD